MPEKQNTNYQSSAAPVGQQNFAIPAAIIIAGAIIGISIYAALSSKGGAAQTGGTQPPAKVGDISKVKITDDDPYIGRKDAPVTLAYWFDYQCPFCKAVDVGGIPQIPIEPSMPTLIRDYVNTGKLRIIFKDFAFLGPDSTTAALYENAIWDSNPDKFYEWHEAMFKAQDEEHGGFGNEESILTLIRTIDGLDANALKALVAKNKDAYTALIEADRTEGSSLGVQGTPAFITGKTFIDGAQPLANFKSAIDAQLK